MEEELNTPATSRRALVKESDTSLAGGKRKKLREGVAEKAEKDIPEQKCLSRNICFAVISCFSKKTNQQQP
eukprot:2997064-Ditylum_brightwellii.AAC.1